MSAADTSSRRGRRRVFGGYEKGGFSVKREPDEDIKDYAETTMNELLGWYGYEKVDSRDTQGLNLTHFAASGAGAANAPSPPSSALEGSDASEDCPSSLRLLEERRRDSDSPGLEASTTASDEVARQHQQMVSALSSITKHPDAPDSPNLPPGCIVCAWCQKMGMKLFTLKTPNGCKAFCSELCFTQCRRASFKKNKICDWCKHVRHTVNYVDFQDGEQQLQFCSDKCLNQYKMNIFCKETQAHLQMHTHLKEAACKLAAGTPASAAERNNAVNLITPELWLRDCKQHVANGGGLSPNAPAVDVVIEDVTSDDNGSTSVTSPAVVTSPRPKSRSPLPPPVKEAKKEGKPKPAKEREKIQRKHSKLATRRSESDNRTHHTKHKKAELDVVPNEPPSHLSPPSANRSALSNGSTPHLLSPPMGLARAPPPPHHMPPQRHHCPPAPSPLNIAVDQQQQRQQPFLTPGLVPPPFHFLAQQQMEAILRNQHELDLRSKVPPLSMPPWVMPPFHQASLPPPPPPLPPPPLTSRSPSVPRSSSSPEKHHSHQHQLPHHANPKTNQHRKPRHRRPNHSSSSSAIPRENNNTLPASSSAAVGPQSLLPPVTVMVPFPLLVPVPVPIPIPIPVPQKVFDKLQNRKQIPSPAGVANEGANVIKSNRRTHEPSKHAPVKKRRHYKAHRSDASVRLGVLENQLFTEARNTVVENSVGTELAKSRRKLGSNLDQMYKAKISVGYLREYAALRGCFQTEEYPIYGQKRKRSDEHSVDVSLPDFSDMTLTGALNHVNLSNFDVISGNNSLPLALEKSRNRSDRFNEMELVREINGEGLLTSNVSPSADLANAPDVVSDDHDEDRSSSDNRNSEERLRGITPPYDLVKKLVLKVSNSVNATEKLDRQSLVTTTAADEVARGTDTDKDSSRSVSPLSDMSGEDIKQNDTNNNGDIDHYPRITFSPYNLSSRSSPVTSLVADLHVGLPNIAYTKSPAPENLMVHDRKEGASTPEESSYFKRKCMRDNLSLMT